MTNYPKKPLIIENLVFSYPHQNPSLNNINLSVTQGEKIGVIGANGAGKTTLFLLICGLLTPQNGKIQLFDQPIKMGEFRPEIGLVFQNPNDQLFCPRVWDDVAFGCENMGLSSEEIHTRVTEALTLTGALHLADRIPHHLSGGEKCMVAIASILAMKPQLILYDEPSSNLDLKARRRLINFLQNSPETLIISSHDLEMILEICDRLILLDQGKIIADNNPKTIMANQELMENHHLEIPHSLINN
jgi:cobalt/nickel transport system ATP-binding protein